jgi:hypothetical protein
MSERMTSEFTSGEITKGQKYPNPSNFSVLRMDFNKG